MKQLFLSKPYGFCFGVKKALLIVDKTLTENPGNKIWVINEIVHNKTIVEDLESKGVRFTNDPAKVPDGAIVIFSAHGVTPQLRAAFQGRPITVLDATCPLVQKVHDEVLRYSQNGYHIIYIGSKTHDEARGVIAENPKNISVVETANDIAQIKKGFEKYIILTQTTLNMFEVNALIEKIRQVLPQIETPQKKDLCLTTTTRQQAVKKNAARCQVFFVVGSKNSSNSKKLRDIAEQAGSKSYLIDSAKEIKAQWLTGTPDVCLTSGASAPDILINEVIDLLTNTYGYTFSE
jgi:4-hydroxy-3-methylbut-2-en-1-yl diphosphate reductase